MFTNFGEKTPNRFQVIVFCFKGDKKLMLHFLRRFLGVNAALFSESTEMAELLRLRHYRARLLSILSPYRNSYQTRTHNYKLP